MESKGGSDGGGERKGSVSRDRRELRKKRLEQRKHREKAETKAPQAGEGDGGDVGGAAAADDKPIEEKADQPIDTPEDGGGVAESKSEGRKADDDAVPGAKRGRGSRRGRSDGGSGAAAGGGSGGGGGGDGGLDDDNKENVAADGASNRYAMLRANLKALISGTDSKRYGIPSVTDLSLQQMDIEADDCAKEPVMLQDIGRVLRVDWDDGTAHQSHAFTGGTSNQELFADVDGIGADDEPLLGDSTKGGGRESKGAARNQVLFMESESTGHFVKLRETKKTGKEKGGDLRKEEFLKYMNLIITTMRFFRAMWIFVQGLVAGFSASPIYMAYAAASDAVFIAEYAHVANEGRRALFVLCTLSLVGALETYRNARHPIQFGQPINMAGTGPAGLVGGVEGIEIARTRQWKSRGLLEKFALMIMPLIYLVVFVSTMLCSVGDIVFYYHNGWLEDDQILADDNDNDVVLTDDLWASEALDSKKFRLKLRIWYAASSVRFAFAMLGWFVVCYCYYVDQVVIEKSMEDAEKMSKRISGVQEQVRRLSGATSTLAAMNKDELEHLMRLQKNAMTMTERTLQLRGRGGGGDGAIGASGPGVGSQRGQEGPSLV